MPGKAAKVVVSERQLVILDEFRRSKTEPRFVSERAAPDKPARVAQVAKQEFE